MSIDNSSILGQTDLAVNAISSAEPQTVLLASEPPATGSVARPPSPRSTRRSRRRAKASRGRLPVAEVAKLAYACAVYQQHLRSRTVRARWLYVIAVLALFYVTDVSTAVIVGVSWNTFLGKAQTQVNGGRTWRARQ